MAGYYLENEKVLINSSQWFLTEMEWYLPEVIVPKTDSSNVSWNKIPQGLTAGPGIHAQSPQRQWTHS